MVSLPEGPPLPGHVQGVVAYPGLGHLAVRVDQKDGRVDRHVGLGDVEQDQREPLGLALPVVVDQEPLPVR